MGGGGGGRGGGGGFGGNRGGYQEETRYNIPAEKCGLVIGKGGETIKEINRSSGAFVQLERQQGPDPNIRTAIVRGNPDQIRNAIDMICEKAGLVCYCFSFSCPYFSLLVNTVKMF